MLVDQVEGRQGHRSALFTEGVLARVGDVEETIFVLVLLVDGAHKRSSRWQDFIDEDEDGLLRAQLDALSDNVDELADGEVCRHQVLLLIDGRDVGFLDLLADDWDAVGVLLADALRLCLALLKGVLVLELGTHSG